MFMKSHAKLVEYVDRPSGYQGMIYRRVDTGELVVAHRGTEFERQLQQDGVSADGGMYLKSLDIGYFFYTGRYLDAIMKVLDPSLKTIIHI
ncbi:hypothetical protein AEA00_09995 [Xanthomonas campestris pv. campestris]|nr:hypothetical protein AEA00_09995 [Xanthomonas campestris pv. campestris]